jgi:beta-galactosidase
MDRRAFLACAAVIPYTLTHFGEQRAEAAQAASSVAAPGDPQNAVFVKGTKRVLSWDSAGTWQMDGSAFQFFGGEVHPARIPEQYWEHRIQMVKALGCNTISIYIMWNFHERADGSFDFCSPNKDMGKFIDLCAKNGLWVLLRPGPYVCGEWDFGGLPPRMLSDPKFRDAAGKVQIRQNAPNYMAAVKAWNSGVYENVVKGRTLKDGGPIMLVGLENEYSSWNDYKDPAYIAELAKQWLALGYSEKFCVCDGWANGFTNNGLTLPPNTAYGMTAEGDTSANYDKAISLNKTAPFGAECYPGWLTHWADTQQIINIDAFAVVIARLAQAKRSFVLYVAHGGTNFGFTAGSNDTLANTQADITSYDYGAPISEMGTENDNFFSIQSAYVLNASYEVPFAAKPAPVPAITDLGIPTIDKSKFGFRNFLKRTTVPIKSDVPQTIEWLALYMNEQKFTTYGVYPSGIAIYQVTLPAAGGNFQITFQRSPDYAIAYVNDVLVPGGPLTTVAGLPKKIALTITAAPASAILKIVVMPFGRCNFAAGMLTDGRGLSGTVSAGGVALKGWSMSLSPMTAKDITNFTFDSAEAVAGSPFHAKASFNVDSPKDMYIDMTDWETGHVFVNGHNLGRYWTQAGPQKRLYCPGAWLVSGQNSIVIFELTKGSAGSVSFYGTSGLKYSDRASVTAPVVANPAGYYIQSLQPNLSLQSNSGTAVLAATNADNPAQVWNITPDTGAFKISNRADQSVLNLNGSTTEKWLATPMRSGLFTLTSVPENLSLGTDSSVKSGVRSTSLVTTAKPTTETQWPFNRYWRIVPAVTVIVSGVYYLTNKSTNLRLGGSGTIVATEATSSLDRQKWTIAPSPITGGWLIINVGSKTYLDVDAHGKLDDNPVGLWVATGALNQAFNFVPRMDGTGYAIISLESGSALTMKDGAPRLTIWKDAGDANQTWLLTKI